MFKKIDQDTIQNINLFEQVTKAKVKNYFSNNDVLNFIVEHTEMGKAIGKNASNIKRLTSLFKKKIRVIEFNKNPINFIKNLIYPLKPQEINQNEQEIEIKADTKTKALLIGRNQQNLKLYNDILDHYFKLKIIVR
ncbi:MAG: NusA-like transcription termination signal-binding factor [Nanoarchaeota archaeon]|nr:NusA-like transcription termination signal-binding factor [Nanoarchaeota archaeon]